MNTYKDLFELCSRPEEVITMDEAIISKQEETVNNYIITENLKDSFNKVFHYFTLEKGKGFWVQGAYGSGKSHFMSFLTILLHYDIYWENIPKEFKEEYRLKIKNKRFLTINFTLSEVNNLRVKIFDEIEKALRRDGHDIYIKNDKKIVEQFLNNEFEFLQKDKFYSILNNECRITKEQWDEYIFLKNINKLAEIIIIYKQKIGVFSQKEYREIIYPNIRDGMQQIMNKIDKYYDGMVIFIDELSEFLQKKKAKGEEADALETIQALGQRIKNGPIWILAAVQKNPAEIIDEFLYISNEEEKVFDRFEPIILSQVDIEEIIDKRLIIKTKNNLRSIHYIYEDLEKKIPQLAEYVTVGRFIHLYPFHHEFVNSLIFLSNYGSRQRVAIRECWRIVSEHLNDPVDSLITIDLLYDVFKDTVIHDYFKPYYDLYENLYSDLILKPNFSSDRDLARRLVKALIINGINKKQALNSKELAHLLMVDMGLGMELTLIYDDIYYTLLEIYEKSRGKGIDMQEAEAGEQVINHLWEIDPGSSGVKVEPEIITEAKFLNDNDLAGTVQEIINSNHDLFSDYEVYWNSVCKINTGFTWRNTDRYGFTIMKNISKLIELPVFDSVRDDIDFCLILGFPLFGNYEDKIKYVLKLAKKDARFIFWIPSNLQGDLLHQLKRLVAIKRLLSKYDQAKNDEEHEKKIQLNISYNQLKEEINKGVEKCYFSGIMINQEKIENNLSQFNNLKNIIEYLLNFPLDKLYYKHPRYSKKITRFQTNKLIKDFIIPRVSKKLTNEIENIAEPFDLVEKTRCRYELRLNNEIFSRINKIIKNGEWHGLDQIYHLIRVKPWGIQEIGFELIIAALISNGDCRGKTKNGEILNSDNFSRNLIGGGKNLSKLVVSISKGNLLNNNIWIELTEIIDFLDIDYKDQKSLLNQDRVWSRIINRISELDHKIVIAKRYFLELGAELDQFEGFKTSLVTIENYREFLVEIENLKNYDSYEGLSKFRQTVLDKFTKIGIFKEEHLRILDFLLLADARIDVRLKKEYQYFNNLININEKIDGIKKDFRRIGKIIINPNELKAFMKNIEKTKEDYQKQYIAAHQQYFSEYQHFWDQLYLLKEYQTLSLLAKIEKLEVYPSLQDRLKKIENNYLPFCHCNLTRKDLEDTPYCSCGFKPDDKFIALDLNKIRKDFGVGIKSYLKEIKTDNYLKQIQFYLNKKSDSKLRKLLEIESYDLDKIMNVIDEKTILEINQAFKATYPIQIELDKVLAMFKGSIPGSQIKTLGKRISTYLMKKVKEKLRSQQNISLDRVIIFFKENPQERKKYNWGEIDIDSKEENLLGILELKEEIAEKDLAQALELRGYNSSLIKGLIMKLNRKYDYKYGENLIAIIQKEQPYYSLNKIREGREIKHG